MYLCTLDRLPEKKINSLNSKFFSRGPFQKVPIPSGSTANNPTAILTQKCVFQHNVYLKRY